MSESLQDRAERQRAEERRHDQTLSGQQMQAMAARYAEELGKIRKDVELRKLALDQACNVIAQTNSVPGTQVTFHDPIALAKAMHAFLVEGASENKS
jgi:hypothetical protein